MTDHTQRNETAEDSKDDHSSADGPEPTGAETAGALGAPTPTDRTEGSTDSADKS